MKALKNLAFLFALLCIIGTGCSQTGYTLLTGRYVKSNFGDDVIVTLINGKETAVFMNDQTNGKNPFDKLETGDAIEIKTVIVSSYDGTEHADVFECQKCFDVPIQISKDTIEYINSLSEKEQS